MQIGFDFFFVDEEVVELCGCVSDVGHGEVRLFWFVCLVRFLMNMFAVVRFGICDIGRGGWWW